MTQFHHSSFGWVETEDHSAQAYWDLVWDAQRQPTTVKPNLLPSSKAMVREAAARTRKVADTAVETFAAVEIGDWRIGGDTDE